MLTIIETLKKGTSRERLSVIADILSILGVSVAAILGGTLTLGKNLDISNIFGIAILSLLSLAGAALVLVVFLAISARISLDSRENKVFRNLYLFSWWSLFSALLLLGIYLSFDIISSVRFTR